jgi:hypothetical protein
MMLGLSLAAFTLLHVVISLVGIATGIVVVVGMLSGKRLPALTALFLITTVLTDITGYMLPAAKLLPSHIVGAISLVVLAVTIAALYMHRLAGAWRWIYVVGAITSLYLNVFVAVVQSFLKIPALNALAPTQSSEPAFVGAQGFVMAVAILAGVLATRRFHPAMGVVPAHA